MTPAELATLLEQGWAYLRDYGYLLPVAAVPESTSQIAMPQSLTWRGIFPALAEAVAFGLGKTATLDVTETPRLLKELLTTPRCRFPDRVVQAQATCQWPMLDITYWESIELPGLSRTAIQGCYDRAVQSWADVCGIRPSRVRDQAEANIWALGKPIDGPGSVLAWSYLPCGATQRTQLEQRYDTRDQWSRYGERYLEGTICHEFGHALGLDHLPAGNLLQPFAVDGLYKPQRGDIAAVVSRYGKPTPLPPPTPDPTPPAPPPGYVPVFVEVDGKRYQTNWLRVN